LIPPAYPRANSHVERTHRIDEEEVYRGRIKQIKVGKEKVSKVAQGKECGILFKDGVDFHEGDVVEIL